MNYIASANWHIPQSTIYDHYRSSIARKEDEAIPLLLKGVEFISLVPRVHNGVTLTGKGYLCLGLKRREADEVERTWKEAEGKL